MKPAKKRPAPVKVKTQLRAVEPAYDMQMTPIRNLRG
jgi:hypothetical protein